MASFSGVDGRDDEDEDGDAGAPPCSTGTTCWAAPNRGAGRAGGRGRRGAGDLASCVNTSTVVNARGRWRRGGVGTSLTGGAGTRAALWCWGRLVRSFPGRSGESAGGAWPPMLKRRQSLAVPPTLR